MSRKLVELIFYTLQVIVIWGFIRRNEYAYLVNPLLTLSIYLLIILLERWIRFRLKPGTRVCLVLTLLAHSIGEYFYVYEKVAVFDVILHFWGTFSFSLVGYSLLRLLHLQSSKPLLATVIVVSILGVTLGTLLELSEFVLDVLFDSYNQRGLVDTNLDLVLDLFGGLGAGIYLMYTDPLA